MQPNTNRPPGEADNPAGNNANDGEFDPADSFSNDSSDRGVSGELPSWLQNFAGVAGESGGNVQPAAAASTDVEPSRAPVSHAQPQQGTPQPDMTAEDLDPFGQLPVGADSNFFSEDDLPEWLRALSTDSEPAVEAAAAAMALAASPPTNGALQVPTVSRAWVTASDQPEASPGANLLSSLVNVIDSRPDTVAVEPSVAGSASPPSARPAVAPQEAAPVTAQPTTTVEAASSNRTRTLLIAAIVILVLIIVVMLLGN